MPDHIFIGTKDRKLFRYAFHPRRAEACIEFGGVELKGIVWQEQDERYLRVALFCFAYRTCRHCIKVSVMPDDKFCHPVFGDASFYSIGQQRAQSLRRISVADEKAGC